MNSATIDLDAGARYQLPAGTDTSDAIGLPALEARLAQELAYLTLPAASWVPPREIDGQRALEVAVIGGGMAGMVAAAALRHLGIDAVIFDQAPAGLEGPWATTARMETLRSPKTLTGPALGLASLTFRAWFEAQHGSAAWEALDKIPRLQWMDYLRWYRRVMALDVRNEHRVARVLPRGDGCVQLDMQSAHGDQRVLARHVVLATGRDGLGGPQVPDMASVLPRERWAHSSDVYDYTRLAGLRVGVIGAGASAMDSAATALEAGAARVDLLVRRADLPRINKGKGAGNPGSVHGHLDLPDPWKWRIRHYINSQQVPPPRGSTLRVSQHPQAFFHLSCPLQGMRMTDQGIEVSTPKGLFHFDFIVFSTGFRVDWAQRPFLSALAGSVRMWGDRFVAPADLADTELDDSPDLGPAFEFQPKRVGDCPGLERVHCFCYPAALTHGTVSGDIPAISDGARRLAQGIASTLYGEDIEQHYANLEAFAEPELLGDEWKVTTP